MNTINESELTEVLASYSHVAWSEWMYYLFSHSKKNEDGSCTIPSRLVNRWNRQLNESYDELSENEKLSNREEAEEIMRCIDSFVKSKINDELEETLSELYGMGQETVYCAVATLCDEKLDRSGGLLGRVQERARKLSEK